MHDVYFIGGAND